MWSAFFWGGGFLFWGVCGSLAGGSLRNGWTLGRGYNLVVGLLVGMEDVWTWGMGDGSIIYLFE